MAPNQSEQWTYLFSRTRGLRKEEKGPLKEGELRRWMGTMRFLKNRESGHFPPHFETLHCGVFLSSSASCTLPAVSSSFQATGVLFGVLCPSPLKLLLTCWARALRLWAIHCEREPQQPNCRWKYASSGWFSANPEFCNGKGNKKK